MSEPVCPGPSAASSNTLRQLFRGLFLTVAVALPLICAGQSKASDALLRATAKIRALTEQQVIDMVPKQSGLQYIDCPNCTMGHQERQLVWSIDQPDEVVCQHCKHKYPSETYPMDKELTVRTPRGGQATFKYWEDSAGYRHFFNARRDDEARKVLAAQCQQLAQLWKSTGDQAHARRAAVIIDRFAQVFPDWCYHFDYPFRQKIIYDGNVDPADFRPGFRTARWNWWAYHDIPINLVEAHRLLKTGTIYEELSREQGVDVALRIENDLLRNAGEQVFANVDEVHNMSPGCWRELVQLSTVINEPRYVHEVVRRFERMLKTQFYYDGVWFEGAPSYHLQTVNGLSNFLKSLEGYSDPPGYVDAVDGTRFENLDLLEKFPLLRQSRESFQTMLLPNGRLVPVHDTWAFSEQQRKVDQARSWLLPALGHAALVSGQGPQRAEFHLTWSGGYGHQHADGLSLLMFANGAEDLSDIGYTHTAYRSWSLATAAHNTVVIDRKTQYPGGYDRPTDGSLELFDRSQPGIQLVRVDNGRVYDKVARKYARTLLVIDAGQDQRYAIDLFDVDGGNVHDYFLHGNADHPTTASTQVALKDLATLLPAGMKWEPTTNEGQGGKGMSNDYPYGFLTQLKSGPVTSGQPVEVDFATQPAKGKPTFVRVTLVPQSDSQLVLGQNPSIRSAKEDDGNLLKFHRPMLILRREAGDQPSRFVSVIEPHTGTAAVTSVKSWPSTGGATVLEVTVGDRTDLICLDAAGKQSIPVDVAGLKTVTFQGTVGVLSVRNRKIESAYVIGNGGWNSGAESLKAPALQSVSLKAFENGALIVPAKGIEAPAAGEVIRVKTTNGWTYPVTVVSTEVDRDKDQLSIRFVESEAFTFKPDAGEFSLNAYPHRAHQGAITVEWQPSLSRSFVKTATR